MKLLLFSDLHADAVATERIDKESQSTDLLIGAGDFANIRRHLNRCIDICGRSIDRPTILVAGNNESTNELGAACRNWSAAHILHGSSVTLSEVTFYGVGGGIPITPFGDWSYDFSEEDARNCLSKDR